MHFACLRQGGFNQHYTAHGVTAVLGRKRAVENFHLRNFTRTHHGPARRATPTGLQQIMQRHAVGKYHGARRGKHIGTAQAKGTVGIANITFANHQTRLVFNQVLSGGRIDADHIFLRQHTGGIGITGVTHIACVTPDFYLFNRLRIFSALFFQHLFMCLRNAGHTHTQHTSTRQHNRQQPSH